MRVLMLSDLYPPSQGGIEHHVHLLSRELVSRGHEVAVCTIGREDLPPYEEVEGVRIYRLTGFFQSIPFIYRDDSRRWPPPAYDRAVSR
jgi:glycosyltransferase involved in cell wall biosynthesis